MDLCSFHVWQHLGCRDKMQLAVPHLVTEECRGLILFSNEILGRLFLYCNDVTMLKINVKPLESLCFSFLNRATFVRKIWDCDWLKSWCQIQKYLRCRFLLWWQDMRPHTITLPISRREFGERAAVQSLHTGGVRLAVAEEDDWLIINLSILQRDGISNMCIWILHTILTFATRGSLRWEERARKTISTFTASCRQEQVKDWMQFDRGTTCILG